MHWADQAEQFVQALASPEPTPGGGAAAATAGAMGCALVLMAVSTTLKRKGTPATFVPDLEKSNRQFTQWLSSLQKLARQDAEAYADYVAACKLSKEDSSRSQVMQEALWKAALVPTDTAEVCRQALREAETIGDKIAPVILSDVCCARHLLRGAIACCIENIRTNLQYIKDPEQIARLKKLLEAYESNGK